MRLLYTISILMVGTLAFGQHLRIDVYKDDRRNDAQILNDTMESLRYQEDTYLYRTLSLGGVVEISRNLERITENDTIAILDKPVIQEVPKSLILAQSDVESKVRVKRRKSNLLPIFRATRLRKRKLKRYRGQCPW